MYFNQKEHKLLVWNLIYNIPFIFVSSARKKKMHYFTLTKRFLPIDHFTDNENIMQ
jgi:hypothetical protein